MGNPGEQRRVLTDIGEFRSTGDGCWVMSVKWQQGELDVVCIGPAVDSDCVSVLEHVLARLDGLAEFALEFARERSPWPSADRPPRLEQIVFDTPAAPDGLRFDFEIRPSGRPPLALRVSFLRGVPVQSSWEYG